MKYQDCAEALQADDGADSGAVALTDANINPATGLATDYLNHFNEAIMLLEMLSSCPDCRDDLLAWQPMSYREHFAAALADRAAALLKPLIARTGALINGEDLTGAAIPRRRRWRSTR
jgi:hypothetical protein